MLLNPDTVTDKEAIKILMSEVNEQTILQPLILLHENGNKTDLVNTAGNDLNFMGFSYCGHYKEEASNFTYKAEITIASGACSIYPAKLFKDTEAFDNSFFMYHEDVDLSWRAKMLGYNSFLLPLAKVWHKYSFSKNKGKYFYIERNRHLFLLKNYQIWTLILLLPLTIIIELLMIAFSILKGWSKEKARSYLSIITNLPTVIRKRAVIQKARRVTDRALSSRLTTNLGFEEVKVPGMGILNLFLRAYWTLIRIFI